MISENRIIDWVDSVGGLCLTRKTINIKKINIDGLDYAPFFCITGYQKIIDDFFNHHIKLIRRPIVLIIMESDNVILKNEWLENEKISHCFTWNKPFEHKKLSCLPIGINHYRHFEELSNWLKNRVNIEENDKKLLCMNCSLHTNKMRKELYDKVKKWDFCTQIEQIENKRTYFEKSNIEGRIKIDVVNPECYSIWSNYKFILSPPGEGVDCHRTWEAMYMGCIPIVISSSLNELYEDLPVLVVNNWDEITEEYLNEQYEIIKNKNKNKDKLSLNYWINKIKDKVNLKNKPKIHFITYANDVFKDAKKRILKEAVEFGEFDTVKGYGPEDLPDDFIEKNKDILNMRRGGGYWIWRPKIIKQALNNLSNEDYLVYLDAGCKLNNKGKERFNDYIKLLENSNYSILNFQMSGKHNIGDLCKERVWTTNEIFKEFDVNINGDIANSGQYLGGVFILKKNEYVINYINNIQKIIDRNPKLITDYYNSNNQNKDFKDNRHEQSLISVYLKKTGSVVIDCDESHVIPYGSVESLKYPFWATRSKK